MIAHRHHRGNTAIKHFRADFGHRIVQSHIAMDERHAFGEALREPQFEIAIAAESGRRTKARDGWLAHAGTRSDFRKRQADHLIRVAQHKARDQLLRRSHFIKQRLNTIEQRRCRAGRGIFSDRFRRILADN